MLSWLHWVLHPNNPKHEREGSWLELVWRTIVTIFRYPINRILHTKSPYFTPGAVKFLEKYLEFYNRSKMSVFEYGMGKSSFWWAGKVDKYVGVEHHKDWYDKVKQEIQSVDLKAKIELIHIPTLDVTIENWEEEWRYFHEKGGPPDKPEFLQYIKAIDNFQDGTFDIISIDGRERVGSAFHAKSKMKSTGIIILDDSARPRYREAIEYYQDMEVIHFDMGLQRTSIFFGAKNRYFRENISGKIK